MKPNCLAGTHPFCVAVSDANTLRTSDWEIPNWRAMRDGVMPTLKAARTALICPLVNEAVSACRLTLDDKRFGIDASGVVARIPGGNLPRRFASLTDAVMSRSSSLSVRYLTALGRSLGSTWRFEAVSDADSMAETRLDGGGEASRTKSVEKRSGVAGSVRSRPMR